MTFSIVIKQIPGIPRIPEVSIVGRFIGIAMPMTGLKACRVMSAAMLKNTDFIDFKKGLGSLKILNMKKIKISKSGIRIL